jgi:hypothetical protein
MIFFEAIVGMVLLLAGRRLYWLFVGIAGFALGVGLASYFYKGESQSMVLLIALGAGLAGVLLANTLQRLALTVAGFVAGGYALSNLVRLLNLHVSVDPWVLYLVGGTIGAAIVLLMFGWALIILSSTTGAILIMDALKFGSTLTLLLFIILTGVGIVYQSGMLARRKFFRRHR